MRFFKKFGGIIWEFNSIGEYIDFLIGRVVGFIVFVALILGVLYLIGRAS